jgi:hypothetical protein
VAAANDGGGADHWVRTHLLAAQTVDAIWLDRGHNLAGRTIYLEGGNDGLTWPTVQSFVVPAGVGGSITPPDMCGTEEGAAWTVYNSVGPHAWWRLRVPYDAGFIPVIPGVIVGRRTHLLSYSTVFDEDAGERTQLTQQSTAGYRAVDTTYSWRTAELGLAYIGAAEYDGMIRQLREALFSKNAAVMLCLDAGTHPERTWLFQYDGTTWGMAKSRVLRNGRIRLREVGASLG